MKTRMRPLLNDKPTQAIFYTVNGHTIFGVPARPEPHGDDR